MVRSFTHDGPGTPASEWAERPEWEHVRSAELDGFDHVLVVAAHPDDETLGAGGLIATAAAADLDVHLFVCTAGEHSHPSSTTHRPEDLATRRESEVRAALGELAPGAGITLLHVQDGHLREHEQTLVALLVRLVKDGRRTLVVAPWRHDGHPDHDAAGRAAATTAHRTGATLWEYPIWWWHWAQPGEAPWDDLRQLELTDTATRRRRRALAHHRSQTEPLSDAPGDEALLGPHFVQHFTGPRDRFIQQDTPDDALDRLHRAEPDPWGVDERRYERRKRALSLAMLPRDRFTRGLEIGCSVGALTADLTQHCDALVALDSSYSAVESARQRLAVDSSSSQVEVRLAEVPADWPEGLFDLVVVSEIGYFLSPRDLDDLAERIRESLTPDGVLLLCHWRHPVVGWVAQRRAGACRSSRRHTCGRCRGATPNETSKRSCCAQTRPGRTPTHDGSAAVGRARGDPGAQRGRADRAVPDVGPRRRCPPSRQHGSGGDPDRRRRQLHGLDRRGRPSARRRSARAPGPRRRSSSRRRGSTRAGSLESVGRIANLDRDDRRRLHGLTGLAGSPASGGARRSRTLDRVSAAGPWEPARLRRCGSGPHDTTTPTSCTSTAPTSASPRQPTSEQEGSLPSPSTRTSSSCGLRSGQAAPGPREGRQCGRPAAPTGERPAASPGTSGRSSPSWRAP